MPSKKSRSNQPTQKQTRRDLARLKKAGLYTGDLRKAPTRYARGQVKKFADVLRGSAKVVEAPTRKEARAYRTTFKTKFGKVIVPVRKGDKLRFDKKTGEIITTRKSYGGRRERITHPKKLRTLNDLDKLPQGRNIVYRLPIGKSGAMETMTFEQVKRFYSSGASAGGRKGKEGKHSREFLAAYLEIVEQEGIETEDSDYEDIYGDDEQDEE